MAEFDRILLYKVKAKAALPFHTGGSENKEELLIDNENRPYIQANSISGAFGEYAKLHFPSQKEKLFGSQNTKSSIVFSDGIIKDFNVERRPGVKIDGRTGTAEKHGFFGMNFIGAGFTLEFDISVFEKGAEENADMVNEMLSAFNNGEILLGGQKTKGCGRFIITSLQNKILDMHSSADMNSWLDDSYTLEDITSDLAHKEEKDFYDISMKGDIVNSLIVKGGSSDKIDTDCESIKTNGRYYVPGSSLKGVVRHRTMQIADYKKLGKNFAEYIFGRESRDDNGVKGKIVFEDALIENAVSKKMHRIHIDKFTGGVINGAKFDETVVSGSLDIHIKVSKNIVFEGKDRSEEAAALALLVLRDIGCGIVGLGGLASVGRGFIRADKILIDGAENGEFINRCIQKLSIYAGEEAQ